LHQAELIKAFSLNLYHFACRAKTIQAGASPRVIGKEESGAS